MKIDITRTNENVLFEVKNGSSTSSFVDGPPEIGGVDGGIRPMEMVLAAVATCSAFEIVNILKKQRQRIDIFTISVEGKRNKKGTSNPFSEIHVAFNLEGEIDTKKANRAADLAINKYCSVKTSLHPDIKVTSEIKVKN